MASINVARKPFAHSTTATTMTILQKAGAMATVILFWVVFVGLADATFVSRFQALKQQHHGGRSIRKTSMLKMTATPSSRNHDSEAHEGQVGPKLALIRDVLKSPWHQRHVRIGDAYAPPTNTTTDFASSLAQYRHRRKKNDVEIDTNKESKNMADGKVTVTEDGALADGTASIPSEIFSLIKSLVGSGVLGLPAGIAAVYDGNNISNMPPLSEVFASAAMLMVLLGVCSGYGFFLVGRVCHQTQAASFYEAWSKSVSKETKWLPTVTVLFVTFTGILSYSMILADTIPTLMMAGGIELSRNQALVAITTLILLPLCLLKDLKSLAPVSFVGMGGMIYTAVVMSLRYASGDYSMDNAALLPPIQEASLPLQGLDSDPSMALPRVFVLVSMLSTAFMAHYNAPKFYKELSNHTVPRFAAVVSLSFAASIVLFAVISCVGYATFGQATQGLVLNNYASDDVLMNGSRWAVTLSLLGSYPLVFSGVRDGVMELMNSMKQEKHHHTRDDLMTTDEDLIVQDKDESIPFLLTTGALLVLVTALASQFTDLRTLLALKGATCGTALIYLFPTYMFVKCLKQNEATAKSPEIFLAFVMGLMGLVMGVVGTITALQ